MNLVEQVRVADIGSYLHFSTTTTPVGLVIMFEPINASHLSADPFLQVDSPILFFKIFLLRLFINHYNTHSHGLGMLAGGLHKLADLVDGYLIQRQRLAELSCVKM